MRTFLDIISQTLRTLWAHKLRSFLTMFGIAWGVGSLLLLVGLGEGFRSGNKRELAEIGENIIFFWPGTVPVSGGSTAGRRYFVTERDWADVRKEASAVAASAGIIQRGDIKTISQYSSTNGQITGNPPHYAGIRFLPLKEGRWMNELDGEQKRLVAVLGHEMRKNMFPGRPALGETILLNGVRFEVIGVLDGVGRGENNSTNSRVYIPLQTMQQYFPVKGANLPADTLSFIALQPRSAEEHAQATAQVRRIIGRNHGFDGNDLDAFNIWDTIESQKTLGKIFDAMNLFLGSVGLVTLALGAIGIINIMLVSVSERTQEIGLRKALGATNRSIMAQFFLEGLFLTVLSGVIGIVVAGGFMTLLGQLPAPPGFDTPKLVPWSAAVSMIALSFAGIVAGLYPASKAAHLQPVEALRKE